MFDRTTMLTQWITGCMLAFCVSQLGQAQTGSWVLQGWSDVHDGYFAGKTEIYADGGRLKIVEWPRHEEDESQTLETFFLGQTVLKVFPWNGHRVGLVFESNKPLPRAENNVEGELVLPPPFPASPSQESEIPCGEGCVYHTRIVAFESLDESLFAPGGAMERTFLPDDDTPLMSKEEFMARHRMEPPIALPFVLGEKY